MKGVEETDSDLDLSDTSGVEKEHCRQKRLRRSGSLSDIHSCFDEEDSTVTFQGLPAIVPRVGEILWAKAHQSSYWPSLVTRLTAGNVYFRQVGIGEQFRLSRDELTDGTKEFPGSITEQLVREGAEFYKDKQTLQPDVPGFEQRGKELAKAVEEAKAILSQKENKVMKARLRNSYRKCHFVVVDYLAERYIPACEAEAEMMALGHQLPHIKQASELKNPIKILEPPPTDTTGENSSVESTYVLYSESSDSESPVNLVQYKRRVQDHYGENLSTILASLRPALTLVYSGTLGTSRLAELAKGAAAQDFSDYHCLWVLGARQQDVLISTLKLWFRPTFADAKRFWRLLVPETIIRLIMKQDGSDNYYAVENFVRYGLHVKAEAIKRGQSPSMSFPTSMHNPL